MSTAEELIQRSQTVFISDNILLPSCQHKHPKHDVPYNRLSKETAGRIPNQKLITSSANCQMRNIADNKLFTTTIKLLVWYVENKERRLQANGMGCLMLPVDSMCTLQLVLLIVKSCRPILHQNTIGQRNNISLWS